MNLHFRFNIYHFGKPGGCIVSQNLHFSQIPKPLLPIFNNKKCVSEVHFNQVLSSLVHRVLWTLLNLGLLCIECHRKQLAVQIACNFGLLLFHNQWIIVCHSKMVAVLRCKLQQLFQIMTYVHLLLLIILY